MKAERRHELHTNTLAQFLTDLPLYLRFHANKILIGVIVVCLAILLIRHRISSAAQLKQQVQESLQAAEIGIDQLRFADQGQPDDAARASNRRKLTEGLTASINQVLDNTSDSTEPGIRAEALLAQGDMYWTLANLPTLRGAATQPSLSMGKTSAQYLDDAEGSYMRILKSYDSLKVAKATALFGLAAIEENRGNWVKAAEHYKQISEDAGISKMFKAYAEQRITVIPQIKVPVFTGTFSSTQPATAPSTAPMVDAVVPSTLPATMTSLETTIAPATLPATTLPQ